MENENSPQDPPRLIDAPDGLGQLLRAADEDFSKGLNEPKAFRALERRRGRSVRVRHAVITLSTLGALAALALRLTTPGQPPTTAILVTPEVFSVRANPRPSSGRSVVELPTPALAPPAVAPEVTPSTEARVGPRSPEKPTPRLVVPSSVAASAAEPDCRSVEQKPGGSSSAQLACLEVVGRGSGLAAEAALFEVARLTAKTEPERALAALAEHRDRFPGGALRGEVAELQIRLLYELRRDTEALVESERALSTSWGRVLSSPLHLLRGKIYDERLSDCASAVTEYVALVGEAGADGDEAEFRRAACLERLGRASEAATAYGTYLRRPDARRRTTASERLDALGRSVD